MRTIRAVKSINDFGNIPQDTTVLDLRGFSFDELDNVQIERVLNTIPESVHTIRLLCPMTVKGSVTVGLCFSSTMVTLYMSMFEYLDLDNLHKNKSNESLIRNLPIFILSFAFLIAAFLYVDYWNNRKTDSIEDPASYNVLLKRIIQHIPDTIKTIEINSHKLYTQECFFQRLTHASEIKNAVSYALSGVRKNPLIISFPRSYKFGLTKDADLIKKEFDVLGVNPVFLCDPFLSDNRAIREGQMRLFQTVPQQIRVYFDNPNYELLPGLLALSLAHAQLQDWLCEDVIEHILSFLAPENVSLDRIHDKRITAKRILESHNPETVASDNTLSPK